jgi:hypothetical protein
VDLESCHVNEISTFLSAKLNLDWLVIGTFPVGTRDILTAVASECGSASMQAATSFEDVTPSLVLASETSCLFHFIPTLRNAAVALAKQWGS